MPTGLGPVAAVPVRSDVPAADAQKARVGNLENPASASVLPTGIGCPMRDNGHVARRRIRSMRVSVTVTIRVKSFAKPNSIMPAKSS